MEASLDLEEDAFGNEGCDEMGISKLCDDEEESPEDIDFDNKEVFDFVTDGVGNLLISDF